MAYYGYPLLFVVVLWWFSTGAVIYLNNLPKRTHWLTVSVATVVLVLAAATLALTASFSSAFAAYVSFLCGLLAWAWTQLTFYTGLITGPRKKPCPSSCRGIKHFWHAVETCLYHEIAALIVGGVLIAATWGGINKIGMWTYAILWAMHISAKLNVVLGVRNLNEQFFPEALRYLCSFLRERPMNLLFPFSITIGTVISAFLVHKAINAPTQFEAIGYTFYSCLMVLALIEHWFLILPLPFAELWQWGLRARSLKNDADKPSFCARNSIHVVSLKTNALSDHKDCGYASSFQSHSIKVGKQKASTRHPGAEVIVFRKRK